MRTVRVAAGAADRKVRSPGVALDIRARIAARRFVVNEQTVLRQNASVVVEQAEACPFGNCSVGLGHQDGIPLKCQLAILVRIDGRVHGRNGNRLNGRAVAPRGRSNGRRTPG